MEGIKININKSELCPFCDCFLKPQGNKESMELHRSLFTVTLCMNYVLLVHTDISSELLITHPGWSISSARKKFMCLCDLELWSSQPECTWGLVGGWKCFWSTALIYGCAIEQRWLFQRQGKWKDDTRPWNRYFCSLSSFVTFPTILLSDPEGRVCP